LLALNAKVKVTGASGKDKLTVKRIVEKFNFGKTHSAGRSKRQIVNRNKTESEGKHKRIQQ